MRVVIEPSSERAVFELKKKSSTQNAIVAKGQVKVRKRQNATPSYHCSSTEDRSAEVGGRRGKDRVSEVKGKEQRQNYKLRVDEAERKNLSLLSTDHAQFVLKKGKWAGRCPLENTT